MGIRADGVEWMIISFSTNGNPLYVRKGFRLGATGYVPKLGFPFWHPARCQYTANRLPSISSGSVFPLWELFLGSCFCLPKAQFPPAAKTQNRETLYFQRIPQTPLRASPFGCISFACLSPPFTRSPPPARQSAGPCSQTAAASGGFRPASTSSTGRA